MQILISTTRLALLEPGKLDKFILRHHEAQHMWFLKAITTAKLTKHLICYLL